MNSQTKKVILVVEDEQSLLDMLATKLQLAGFGVVTASDGKSGLGVAFKEQPDMIILDLLMPDVDGITMLKQLRQDDWGKRVPVIVATNVDDISALNECLKAGAEDYFVKSETNLGDLVENIRQRLGKGVSETAAEQH